MIYIKEIQFDGNQISNIERLQDEFFLQVKLSSIYSSFKLKLPATSKI